MEGIEHDLDKMRGYLMKDERILDEINNTLPPELLKEWHNG